MIKPRAYIYDTARLDKLADEALEKLIKEANRVQEELIKHGYAINPQLILYGLIQNFILLLLLKHNVSEAFAISRLLKLGRRENGRSGSEEH